MTIQDVAPTFRPQQRNQVHRTTQLNVVVLPAGRQHTCGPGMVGRRGTGVENHQHSRIRSPVRHPGLCHLRLEHYNFMPQEAVQADDQWRRA